MRLRDIYAASGASSSESTFPDKLPILLAQMSTLDFAESYRRASMPEMSELERRATTILIVDSIHATRVALRSALNDLGFPNITEANDHVSGLQKVKERGITHMLFEAKKTNMPVRDFLMQALENDGDLIALPTSSQPTVDDVFNLLTLGARGYLVKPFAQDSIEEAMIMATKGEPLSEAILYAKNRNDALASLILTSLDRLTIVLRQAEKFATAAQEIPTRRLALQRAARLAHTFAEGGESALLEVMVESCIERSEGPASRLGRTRKKIEQRKLRMLGNKASAKGKEKEKKKD